MNNLIKNRLKELKFFEYPSNFFLIIWISIVIGLLPPALFTAFIVAFFNVPIKTGGIVYYEHHTAINIILMVFPTWLFVTVPIWGILMIGKFCIKKVANIFL